MYLSYQIKCIFQIFFLQIYHWPLLECAPILCIHAMLLVQDSKTQMYWSANSLIFWKRFIRFSSVVCGNELRVSKHKKMENSVFFRFFTTSDCFKIVWGLETPPRFFLLTSKCIQFLTYFWLPENHSPGD